MNQLVTWLHQQASIWLASSHMTQRDKPMESHLWIWKSIFHTLFQCSHWLYRYYYCATEQKTQNLKKKRQIKSKKYCTGNFCSSRKGRFMVWMGTKTRPGIWWWSHPILFFNLILSTYIYFTSYSFWTKAWAEGSLHRSSDLTSIWPKVWIKGIIFRLLLSANCWISSMSAELYRKNKIAKTN